MFSHTKRDTDERLRTITGQCLAAVKTKALKTNGELTEEEVAKPERLIRLLSLSLPSDRRGTRWPIVLMLVLIAATITSLMLVRIGRTPVSINAVVEEFSFVAQRPELLLDSMPVESVAITTTGEVTFPPDFKGTTSPAKSVMFKVSRSGDSQSRGRVQIGQVFLHPGTKVLIGSGLTAGRYRIHFDDRSGASLSVGVVGAVELETGGRSERVQLKHPDQIQLEIDPGAVDIEVEFPKSAQTSLQHELSVKNLSFDTSDRFTGSRDTVIANRSTITTGTLSWLALAGRKSDLHVTEPLRFKTSAGELQTVNLSESQISILFSGTVEGAETGPKSHPVLLMPTSLEWLLARQALVIVWGTIVYCTGLLISIVNWLKPSLGGV
jgi:hypothetical protein